MIEVKLVNSENRLNWVEELQSWWKSVVRELSIHCETKEFLTSPPPCWLWAVEWASHVYLVWMQPHERKKSYHSKSDDAKSSQLYLLCSFCNYTFLASITFQIFGCSLSTHGVCTWIEREIESNVGSFVFSSEWITTEKFILHSRLRVIK